MLQAARARLTDLLNAAADEVLAWLMTARRIRWRIERLVNTLDDIEARFVDLRANTPRNREVN